LRTVLIALLITLYVAPALAAKPADTPDISNLMTSDDFSSAGLDKLSEAERAHLSDWVARYRAGAITGPEVVKKPSAQTPQERTIAQVEQEQKRNFEIEAKVLPAFRGWSGSTVFHLDNGQVWQQRQNGRLRYDGEDSTVLITTNMLGRYVLTHRDTRRSIGVKRIK
jgi:hypothetical protein